MRILAWVSLAVLIGSYICIPVGDPDLWWHIVVGRWILAHREVPRVDYWNLFAAGNPWNAYSWSNEVVYAWVDRLAGGKGLAVLQLLLAIVLAGAFQFLLGRCARNYFVGALLGAYTAVACFAHFSLRPQTFVWILFLGAITVADSIARHGLTTGRAITLLLLGMLWANTHLTSIFGLVAVLLWVLEVEDSKPMWRRAIVAALCFVCGTMLTPYCGGEWMTLLQKSGHTVQFGSIDEFKPAHILQFSTVFMLLQLVLLVVIGFQERRVPAWSRCALAGGMILAGLTAVKFLPFASIALSALLAERWRSGRELETQWGNITGGLRELQASFCRLGAQTVGALAFFLGCLAFVNISRVVSEPLDRRLVPKAAVDFIEAKGLSHPVLNEFGSGGYLLYRYSKPDGEPRFKVPIDGRTNVNDPRIWKLYDAAFFGRENWNDYVAAVKPETIMWSQESPLVSILLASESWCRVFTSGSATHEYSLFISREEFDRRPGEFVSSDCAVNSR